MTRKQEFKRLIKRGWSIADAGRNLGMSGNERRALWEKIKQERAA